MCWSDGIAFAALAISLIVAIIQIRTQLQELRPYLSFAGTNGIVKVFEETGIAGMDVNLKLINVGKCVLYYEIMQFDVFVNGIKWPDFDVRNNGSVMGINTETVYNKFYNNFLQYEKGLNPVQYIPPNHRIVFSIEYYRVNRPKKRYKLSYEVTVEFEHGVKRELYGKTFAN